MRFDEGLHVTEYLIFTAVPQNKFRLFEPYCDFGICKSPKWVIVLKIIFHQGQPVLRPGTTGLVISDKPHLWGACDGGDSICRPCEALAGFPALACCS
jgi:hypothetical protein